MLRPLHLVGLLLFTGAADTDPPQDQYGDPLPPGVVARLGTVRLRHGGRVAAVAFSPDGQTVASASWDHTVRLWNVSSGQEVRRFTGHRGWLYSLAFSSDGKTLASAANDKTVRVWDAASGKQLFLLEEDGHTPLAVAFSPDGKQLAVGTEQRTVQMWDVTTGKCQRTKWAHENMVQTVVFSPDGKLLASSGRDQTILLSDSATGKEVRRWKAHDNWINALAFSPDGRTLASACDDKTISVWDVTTGKIVRHLTGHGERVTTVTFSPDGKTLATASWDHTIRLWDGSTGKVMAQTGLWSANSVAFSPDGKTLATGGDDHIVRLWDVATGREHRRVDAHEGRVESLAYFPDGKRLATSGMDGTVRLWDLANNKEVGRLVGHKSRVNTVAVSPDGRTLASGGCDRTIRLWDMAGKEIRRITLDDGWPELVTFSPDGKTLASADQGESVFHWDVATGKLLHSWQRGSAGGQSTAAFSPDGKALVAPGDVGEIRFFDTRRGKTLWTWEGPKWSHGVVFSRDGTLMASPEEETDIRLWRLTPNRTERVLKGHLNQVYSVAFSPDGRFLASGSKGHSMPWDETERGLRLWEVASGKEIRHWASCGEVLALAFSPDGSTVATAGKDGCVLLWEVACWGQGERNTERIIRENALTGVWDELASEDPTVAFQAVCPLATSQAAVVPFLRKRVPAVPVVEQKQLDGLIAKLDNDNFMVRTEAMEALQKLAEVAEPTLLKVLDGKPSLEMRRRIEQLMEAVKEREESVEWLRQRRAVQVLEYINSAEARAVLRSLAERRTGVVADPGGEGGTGTGGKTPTLTPTASSKLFGEAKATGGDGWPRAQLLSRSPLCPEKPPFARRCPVN